MCTFLSTNKTEKLPSARKAQAYTVNKIDVYEKREYSDNATVSSVLTFDFYKFKREKKKNSEDLLCIEETKTHIATKKILENIMKWCRNSILFSNELLVLFVLILTAFFFSCPLFTILLYFILFFLLRPTVDFFFGVSLSEM